MLGNRSIKWSLRKIHPTIHHIMLIGCLRRKDLWNLLTLKSIILHLHSWIRVNSLPCHFDKLIKQIVSFLGCSLNYHCHPWQHQMSYIMTSLFHPLSKSINLLLQHWNNQLQHQQVLLVDLHLSWKIIHQHHLVLVLKLHHFRCQVPLFLQAKVKVSY